MTLRQNAMASLRPGPHDVVVGVGEAHHAAAPARLRTLLGSCVAVLWWHPDLKAGYLAHVVGARSDPKLVRLGRPAGWFADQALPRAARWAAVIDPDPGAWRVTVFGGARQFRSPQRRRTTFDVPAANLAEVRAQLDDAGFEPVGWHVGGTGPRLVVLDVADGAVWLSHTPMPELGPGDPPLRIGRRPAHLLLPAA